VNVGVAYCHSEEERCAVDLDAGTNYYQPAAVGKGKGKVSVHSVSSTGSFFIVQSIVPHCQLKSGGTKCSA